MATTYAQLANVRPRIGNRPLDANSKPNQTEVQAWLDEAEAELLGKLAANAIPTAYAAASTGFLILTAWIANYVAGRTREAHAAAAGDGSNDDGRVLIAGWEKLLAKIDADPDGIAAMLAGGTAPRATIGIGSHTTDTSLGLTETDYAPVFKIKGENF